jgi:hypothetical protein
MCLCSARMHMRQGGRSARHPLGCEAVRRAGEASRACLYHEGVLACSEEAHCLDHVLPQPRSYEPHHCSKHRVAQRLHKGAPLYTSIRYPPSKVHGATQGSHKIMPYVEHRAPQYGGKFPL